MTVWDEIGLLVEEIDVTAFADAWTKQAGFPVVCVEKLENSTFGLTQQRYLVKGSEDSEGNNQTW